MHPIEIDDLTYRYGPRRGIENVSLSVPEGTLFGFLGPNGAGKTTTIRVLLGFLRSTHGRTSIFGKDCWRETRIIKQDVGYVPGDLRLWPWLDGRSALRLFASVRGRDLMPGGTRLADMFELDLSVKVRRMSKGMRQKLGLILAMAHEPRLLILDEPSSGLDPLMQDRLLDYLRSASRQGRTVFFSSHTLSEVERLCDRLAIVRAGRIVFDGVLSELQRQAGHVVRVRWNAGVTPPANGLAALRVIEQSPRAWSAHFGGSIEDLLAWLAGKPIEDLSIARPDLEALFKQYYEEHAAPEQRP
ncbi:MAG TPA: ABC transporter ATP-binding protein [Phycisphaerales bacterium]|nr:ABC transporter ATP-binding protein [Phycisphaerales bacterium]